jgi:galactonate dehydratase
MKIVAIDPILVDRYLFVEIRTDNGIVGLGEASAWAHHTETAEAIRGFATTLIGSDPLTIERHWQFAHRAAHFRGAVLGAAIGAIDIALWDIFGQHLGVPIHALLGGAVRDRVRVYSHVWGSTLEELTTGIREAVANGFTAVGHLSPFHEGEVGVPMSSSPARRVGRAIDAVAAFREAAGDDIDVCVELHRRFTFAEGLQFLRGVEEFRPMFVEDPLTHDNIDEMGVLASRTTVPMATGERYTSIWDFQMLLARRGAEYLRPDPGLLGGITALRKVAILAEANHAGLVPHNPMGPVITAASLHVAAVSSAFAIQEYPEHVAGADYFASPAASDIVEGVSGPDAEGFLPVPSAPGLGITLRPDVAERFPHRVRPLRARRFDDGALTEL